MDRRTGRRLVLAASGLSLLGLPVAATADNRVIKGEGSTFAASVMNDWIGETKQSLGWTVEYSARGSGEGRNRIKAGYVDFALSDEPMPDDVLKLGGLAQFPVLFGGIVPLVNLPGITSNQLRLTAELLGALYTGGIKTWNDPRIAAINPGLKLPDTEVQPVSLATPNGPLFGATHTFTQYLLATNADWRSRHGDRITKRWAVGSMVSSAENMVETMKVLPGSMGYGSIAYATRNGLTMVGLRNKAGKNVAASIDSLRATKSQVDWSKPTAMLPELIDRPGDASWPITNVTFALIPLAPKDRAKGDAVRTLFTHVVTNGEAAANKMHATALPAAARPLILTTLRQYAS